MFEAIFISYSGRSKSHLRLLVGCLVTVLCYFLLKHCAKSSFYCAMGYFYVFWAININYTRVLYIVYRILIASLVVLCSKWRSLYIVSRLFVLFVLFSSHRVIYYLFLGL